jgi:hypothetical protein
MVTVFESESLDEGDRPLGREAFTGEREIRLVHDRVQWRALVNTVMNLRAQ